MSALIDLDAAAAVRAVMEAAGQPVLLELLLASAAVVLAPALMRVQAANALWVRETGAASGSRFRLGIPAHQGAIQSDATEALPTSRLKNIRTDPTAASD
jgi:hypothetical protein